MNDLEEMARCCFGYGRWEAPYWFIGLEEGMSGTLENRITAWEEDGRQSGLSDCRKFHEKIGVTKHHGVGAEIQATWGALILMLLTLKNLPKCDDHILEYQRTLWGTSGGETALIELFGLPAKDLRAGDAQRRQFFTEELIEKVRVQRRDAINAKRVQFNPRFVVMYGITGKDWFGTLAGKTLKPWEIVTRGKSVMTLVPHPADRYRPVPDEKWIEHAQKLTSSGS